MKDLKDYVISIPGFPKEGIIFRDITGILKDAEGLKMSIDGIVEKLKDVDFDVIIGLESRGFMFGVPVAYAMNKPFVPVRKAGKLPREVIQESYALEYGRATVEIHVEDILPGQRVVLVDDLIATGGTAQAAYKLVEKLGAKMVKSVFVIELPALKGREILKDYDIESLVVFDGE